MTPQDAHTIIALAALAANADGTLGHTLTSYIPDREDHQVRGFNVVISDVTELKRLAAEAAGDEDVAVQVVEEAQGGQGARARLVPLHPAALDADQKADPERYREALKYLKKGGIGHEV